MLFRFIVKLILLLGSGKWLEKSLNNYHNLVIDVKLTVFR